MKILLDMDDVLVDWIGPAMKLLGLEWPVAEERWGEHLWDIPATTGISQDTFENTIKAAGADFWAELPWTTEGQDILAVVRDYACDSDIHLCSSPFYGDPGAACGKLCWIARELPGFERRTHLTQHKAMLAKSGAILIDDCQANVRDYSQGGGDAILIPRPWNDLHAVGEVVNWLDSWLRYYRRQLQWGHRIASAGFLTPAEMSCICAEALVD